MIKLKDVYSVPGTTSVFADYVLTDKWIPEIPELAYSVEWSVLKTLDEEGLMSIKRLVDCSYEGDRSASMHTMWFKGSPVAIVQEAGRGGRDHFRRWITDYSLFQEMCNYLRTKLSCSVSQDDVHDPEKLVYPEEVFYFYGQDHGAQLGFPMEPVSTAGGFTLIADCARILKPPMPDYVLVFVDNGFSPMPDYLRRHEHVMQLVAKVSEAELATNPTMAAANAGPDKQECYWYNPVPRPENTKILAV